MELVSFFEICAAPGDHRVTQTCQASPGLFSAPFAARTTAHQRPRPQHQDLTPFSLSPGFHGGYSPERIEAVSPVSSPSLSHEKGAKLLQDADKGHGEHDPRQKQQGEGRDRRCSA